MALLKPFFPSTILFSSINPDYESELWDELYGCMKYIKIPLDVLNTLPVKDRKYIIHKYNKDVEKEKSLHTKNS